MTNFAKNLNKIRISEEEFKECFAEGYEKGVFCYIR